MILKKFSDFSFGGGFHEIEHHLTHMSSAFHVSPFRSSSIVSVDGFGDFASTAWGKGDDSEITIDKKFISTLEFLSISYTVVRI